MIELLPILGAALLAGFLGSAHCLGMCGGISGMIAVNAGVTALSTQLPLAIAYNIGRITSYAVLGAIVGGLGQAAVMTVPAIAGPVKLASGIIIVLIGLQLVFDLRVLAPLERSGARLWQRIAPLAQRLLPITTLSRAYGLGLLWGWLPCGLVYGALLIATTTANAGGGAITMVVFGLGTMPAMVMTGIGAFRLSQSLGNARRAAGVLLIVIGAITLLMPIEMMLMSGNGDGHGMHHH